MNNQINEELIKKIEQITTPFLDKITDLIGSVADEFYSDEEMEMNIFNSEIHRILICATVGFCTMRGLPWDRYDNIHKSQQSRYQLFYELSHGLQQKNKKKENNDIG